MNITEIASQPTDAGVIAALADTAANVQRVDASEGFGASIVAVPDGRTLESLERFLVNPVRRKGTVTLFDPPSFTKYVNRFATTRAIVAADVQANTFTAYLEFHEGEGANGQENTKARHHDFIARYTLRQTEDWKRWVGSHMKGKTQVEFASFLEDNLSNVAEPDGTALLDITQNLHVKTDVTFKSAVRLTDGTSKLTYEENTEGATKGEMRMPTEITLGLQPFEGSGSFSIKARIRYRLKDGVATFWYELVRPDRVIETAFRDVETSLQAGITGPLWIQGQVGA